MSEDEILGRLHDGFVDGIHFPNDTTARLWLREVGGRAYVMDLIGVDRLLCNDFRQGNIILAISATTGVSPDRRALDFLFGPPPDAEPFRKRHAESVEREIRRIMDGTVTLVAIIPSYGCELVALCTKVLIQPV